MQLQSKQTTSFGEGKHDTQVQFGTKPCLPGPCRKHCSARAGGLGQGTARLQNHMADVCWGDGRLWGHLRHCASSRSLYRLLFFSFPLFVFIPSWPLESTLRPAASPPRRLHNPKRPRARVKQPSVSTLNCGQPQQVIRLLLLLLFQQAPTIHTMRELPTHIKRLSIFLTPVEHGAVE